MGCLPAVITLNSNVFLQRRGNCVEKYSSAARNYNQMLQKELHLMHTNLAPVGAHIYYVDIYRPFMDMIQDPTSFGKLNTNNISILLLFLFFRFHRKRI